jgi:hypothetical protein
MARINVTLKASERDALRVLAKREFRDPRAQAALIIRRALEAAGLLPTESGNDDGASDPAAPTPTIFAEKVDVHAQQFNQAVNQHGGVNIIVRGNAKIDGDVLGRDKVTTEFETTE